MGKQHLTLLKGDKAKAIIEEEDIVGRGFWHASFGLIGWWLIQIWQWDEKWLLGALLIAGSSVIQLELWRVRVAKGKSQLRSPILIYLYNLAMKKIIRAGEEECFSSMIKWYLYGCSVCWLVWYFFSEAWIIAAVPLFIGSVDPFAKLGKKWPGHRFHNWLIPKKSLGGMGFGLLAGALLVQLIPLCHWLWQPFLPETLSWGHIYTVYGVGLVSSSLAELFSKDRDNMWIPALSAVAMTVVHFQL